MPNPYTHKQFYFRQFSYRISTQFSSIWPIDKSLSGATIPDQSGHESNGNKEVLCIPKTPALLEPHRHTVYFNIQDTRWESLFPLQRCSRCILESQLTESSRLWPHWKGGIQWNSLCGWIYIYIMQVGISINEKCLISVIEHI